MTFVNAVIFIFPHPPTHPPTHPHSRTCTGSLQQPNDPLKNASKECDTNAVSPAATKAPLQQPTISETSRVKADESIVPMLSLLCSTFILILYFYFIILLFFFNCFLIPCFIFY